MNPVTLPQPPLARRGRPRRHIAGIETEAETKRRRDQEGREEARDLARAFGDAIPFEEGCGHSRGQSEYERAIEIGVIHMLHNEGSRVWRQFTLPNRKRPDIVAECSNGEIWIIEIKSSRDDFRRDSKWLDYLAYCHRMFFATGPRLRERLPQHVGLIHANSFGGTLVRKPRRRRLYRYAQMKSLILKRFPSVRRDPPAGSMPGEALSG
jgi:hypothetical protein